VPVAAKDEKQTATGVKEVVDVSAKKREWGSPQKKIEKEYSLLSPGQLSLLRTIHYFCSS